jgi:hypothetical protein
MLPDRPIDVAYTTKAKREISCTHLGDEMTIYLDAFNSGCFADNYDYGPGLRRQLSRTFIDSVYKSRPLIDRCLVRERQSAAARVKKMGNYT